MHLGNGSSMSCVKNGVCFDTSMGLTPLEGLIMGTRCGSIDPAIVPFVMEKKGLTPAEADTLMNKKSGLLGLCGYTDMRDVHAMVFTAGIGENDDIVREQVCAGLEHMGIFLDKEENSTRKPGARTISTPDSKVKVLVIPTNEELQIAQATLEVLGK